MVNSVTRLLAGFAVATLGACGLAALPSGARAQEPLPLGPYPVGMTQVEYLDPADGGRPLNYMLLYPAAPDPAAAPVKIFLSTNLNLYEDAPFAADGLRHPL